MHGGRQHRHRVHERVEETGVATRVFLDKKTFQERIQPLRAREYYFYDDGEATKIPILLDMLTSIFKNLKDEANYTKLYGEINAALQEDKRDLMKDAVNNLNIEYNDDTPKYLLEELLKNHLKPLLNKARDINIAMSAAVKDKFHLWLFFLRFFKALIDDGSKAKNFLLKVQRRNPF